jgi:hypothetical protein
MTNREFYEDISKTSGVKLDPLFFEMNKIDPEAEYPLHEPLTENYIVGFSKFCFCKEPKKYWVGTQYKCRICNKMMLHS